MSNPLDIVTDPELREALAAVIAGMAPEGVCEVCGEADDTVSCPCGSQPLTQMCEHCHWMTCPDGGECW